jgi:hypothetical protein
MMLANMFTCVFLIHSRTYCPLCSFIRHLVCCLPLMDLYGVW